mgnify:CR=1 FL=1
MFKSEDIIGDIVFVSFSNQETLNDIGVSASSGHFLVKGHDHLGLWLQHPGIIIKKTTDQKGKPLPLKLQKEDTIDGVFLVFWNQINTIMHYPNREGYDFPSEFDKYIGFKNKDR